MSSRFEELGTALRAPGENAIKRWLLLTGPRLWVMFVLMFLVFVLLVGMATVKPVEMRGLLTETNAVQTLFATLLSGAILLVSIVVSINSVVLSQEMTDINQQQKRIDASVEYHRQIEDFIEADITPARPSDFLNAVLYASSRQVKTLTHLAEDSPNDEFERDVREFAEQVAQDVEQARQTLTAGRVGTFRVLLAGLNYNYSGQLHATRGLKHKYSEDLSTEGREAIDRLVDTLKHIGIGREYFKSLYYKRELARLSSRLLYVSLPVIVFTSYVLLALNANMFPDVSFFGLSPLLLSIMFAYTIALAPYVILTAYVIRAATITLRTLAAGPFILQEGSNITSLEWVVQDQSREWELVDQTQDD